MEERNRRLAFGLFLLFWTAWLVAKGFLTEGAERAAILGLGTLLVVTVGVVAFRQTRRDAKASSDDSDRH